MRTDNPSPATLAATLRARAQWHRTESKNYLRHSSDAMRQHERAADELEAQAAHLTSEEH